MWKGVVVLMTIYTHMSQRKLPGGGATLFLFANLRGESLPKNWSLIRS